MDDEKITIMQVRAIAAINDAIRTWWMMASNDGSRYSISANSCSFSFSVLAIIAIVAIVAIAGNFNFSGRY